MSNSISQSGGARPPYFVALDVPSAEEAVALARQLEPYVGGFKIGLELFCAAGPDIVRQIGPDRVFLDLKFHDIPNTVAGAARSVAKLGVQIFNVHCLGGFEMMQAAEQVKEQAPQTKIIGVTILTSHDEASLRRIGLQETPAEAVPRLAQMAQEAGLDGVVCSPKEIAAVRAACGPDFLLVIPGIRPAGAALGDQKRVLTPREALDAGASWLVIGRPITAAPDPTAAAAAVNADLG